MVEITKDSAFIKWLMKWKKNHPDFYEFILFKTLSNIATLTNFTILWLGSGLIFTNFRSIPFHWFIFHYNVEEGGLSGFLSFLLAYMCAQCVNFVVQRKWVFGANISVLKVLPWYIITVTVAGIISIWLPPYVMDWVREDVGGYAETIANVVNIIIQVVINYPMLKFVIMKKE